VSSVARSSTVAVHRLWTGPRGGLIVPVYEYVCGDCEARVDRILPHARVGDPGPCPTCGGVLARRFSRVAVRLQGWGFRATDALVPDRPGRNDFRTVRERAEKLSDTGGA